MSINQVKLSTGIWPVSTIRADEWVDFFIAHPAPARPVIMKDVAGGGQEAVTPPDDSPLWGKYNDEAQLFNRLGRHHEWLLAFATVDVPADWELPAGKALALGIETASPDHPRERKLQYIQHHILGDQGDLAEVTAATNGIITAKERAAGAEKFPSDDGKEAGGVGPAGSDPAGAAQIERADSE